METLITNKLFIIHFNIKVHLILLSLLATTLFAYHYTMFEHVGFQHKSGAPFVKINKEGGSFI